MFLWGHLGKKKSLFCKNTHTRLCISIHMHCVVQIQRQICVFGQTADFYHPNTFSLCRTRHDFWIHSPAGAFACCNNVVLRQPHTITARWLQESIPWVAPSKHHVSHMQLHQEEKILRSETAWIFCDHQHRSVKIQTGNVGAGGRNLQTSALPKPCLHTLQAAGGEQQQPHEQWEPERPCLPPGCPRGAWGAEEADATLPPWWDDFPALCRLLQPPGSSCSSSEGKGWRGLVAFANTVNKMLILCLAVVSLSLVTCSYRSGC